MRLSYTHEALQHFIIAIASLDEAFYLRASSETPSRASRQLYGFSLEHYSKAIQGVLSAKPDSTGALAIVASTVLCFLIELWLGDMLASQRHAMSARKIILSQDFRADFEAHDLLIKHFHPMTFRMGEQFSCSREGSEGIDNANEADNGLLPVSLDLDFNNYNIAKQKFSELSKALMVHGKAAQRSFMHDIVLLKHRLEELLPILDTWHTKVTQLDWNHHITQAHWDHERRLLEIRYRYFRIAITTLPLEDEMTFDEHIQDFRVIVDMCDMVLQETSEIRPGVWRSNEPITTMALSFVGCCCRDASIRRKAIRLLYRYRRLEGVWSSIACGIYAEHVLMLEERDLQDVSTCHDIPQRSRVRPLSFHYDSGKSSQEHRYVLTERLGF